MNGTSYIWTGPLTCERDHSLLDETVDYQFTNGGPIHIWQSSHTRRYRLHVEDHGQRIPTCERDLYVWPGLPRVNGICICERVLYLWRTFHPWTRHPRVNGTRCLLVNETIFFFFFFFAIVRLSAVRLTVMVFSFWQDYIKWDFARLCRV